MTNSQKQIAIAQIAVFGTFAPLVLLCLQWHGAKGLLGWGFLLTFCILRITGASIFLSSPSSEVGVIISAVAVSPMILSTLAIGYESGFSIRRKLPWPLRGTMQIILHIFISIGLSLSIIGGLDFDIKDFSSTKHRALLKLRVGSAIFMAIWLILVGITALSCRYYRHNRGEKLLLIGVLLVLPFLGVRIVYSLLCAVINDADLNIVSGNIVMRVILAIVPEMVIVAIFALIGIESRHVHEI